MYHNPHDKNMLHIIQLVMWLGQMCMTIIQQAIVPAERD